MACVLESGVEALCQGQAGSLGSGSEDGVSRVGLAFDVCSQ